MDWSSNGNLAIALYNTLYIWNYIEDRAWMLFHVENALDYISSVAWIEDGYVVAVGISSGIIQLWDTVGEKLLRTMIGHIGRIPSLSWNAYILSSGSQTGYIHHHDVRIPSQYIYSISAHDKEVCGLTWSPNGQYLASGGNDNQLHIWSSINQNIPTYTTSDHSSAVKAIKWCPWKHNVLATGGGIDDEIIRIWNINIRTCIKSIETNSQICDLLWIENHHELVSAHGEPSNNLIVWKYPNLRKLTELKGHRSRVLSLAISPEGSTLASAAADETVRLWEGFEVSKDKKRRNAVTIYNADIFSMSIR
ncbi:cell division cycle protein 20 homolog [Centruroides vittatus]|uniref:cell division cycle protein 20 homolog n=1 Tax=Centruroides vittatus TaxID=120091 RepID=UPI0035102D34